MSYPEIRIRIQYTDYVVAYSMTYYMMQMLRDLGVRTMRLMTNNPSKYIGLKGYGLAIAGRVPLLTPITKENKRYLETKRLKMGHIYNNDANSHVNDSVVDNGNPIADKSSDGESKT